MKAIILAAGRGTRLKHYTENLPKGMLEFGGKTIIEHQIDTYKSCGIDDIVIVKGFMPEKIDFPGVRYYVNEDYDKTNMVESLFCAEEEFDDEIIVSYADIVFEPRVLSMLIDYEADITVTVDTDWKEYWEARHGSLGKDLESLVIEDSRIVELGKPDPNLEDIDGRYVGLLRFSGDGVDVLKKVYREARSRYWDKVWGVSGNVFQKAYMTDLLQAIIDSGKGVDALKIRRGWLEFDSVEDYEMATGCLSDGALDRFCRIG